MQPLADFFNEAEAGLGHLLVDSLPEDVVVIFDLVGDGGGVWAVRRFGPRVAIRAEQVSHYDCRLTCDVDDFRALIAGDLSSRVGFMDGRLKVEGDVGLVLRLERAVRKRQAG